MEDDPRALWLALQQRYEQQKGVILPEATHECNHLRIQGFKFMNEYNHAMHKLSSKLKFCEKEPSNAEKIENILSTMLPAQMILQQQYRERRFTVYSNPIKTLLRAERHNELLIWNSNQGRPSPCLKYMQMLRNRHQRMPTRMAIIDPRKAKTSARDPVILEVLRAKAKTLSQKTSHQLVQSVVATTTRLRNVAPLSTF